MLHIFKFDSNSNFIRISFSLIQEHLLPEDIKNLCWFNEFILVGLKKNYLLFHENKKESKILFSSGNNTSFTFPMPSNEKEILIGRDGNGITIDYEGKPTRRYGLNFNNNNSNELPNTISYLNPYLLCSFKDFIEIRWLRKDLDLKNNDHNHHYSNNTLIQKLQINSIISTSQENIIILNKEEEEKKKKKKKKKK